MKLYEALAAEAVVVASDLPSLRDALGTEPPVKFFPADDAEALAAAVTSLLENKAAAERLRTAAKTFPLLTAKQRAEKIATWAGSLAH